MTAEDPAPSVTTSLKWSKIHSYSEPSSIGSSIILSACDDVVCFQDINTEDRAYYRASGDNKGNGMTSVVGHALLPIFAFSELCLRPRIFIVTYNDFRVVNILKSNHHEHYKNIRLSETEYLVALSGLPNYSLEVWNWRLGKLLGSIDTSIASPNQIIRLSRSSPLMAGQYVKESGQFLIWEIHLSLEQAYIIKRPTEISFASRDAKISYTFGIDNNVYVSDNIGSLYCVVPQIGSPKLLWKCEDDPGPYETLIIGYKGGFAIHSSTGVVSLIKKQAGVYSPLWRLSTFANIISLRALNNQLYGIALNGTFEILDKPENVNGNFEASCASEKISTDVRNVEIIYPIGRYLAMLVGLTYIELIECSSGKMITRTQMKNIVTIKSHPHYPYIVIGDQTGTITYLSYYNPSKPEFITEFNLSRTWIYEIQFTPSGEVLVVSDRFGDFFIIAGHVANQIGVTGHFNFEFSHLGFCIQKLDDSMHVMILSTMKKESENHIASNKVHRVTYNTSTYHEKTETTINLPDRYTSLQALATNPKQYIGTLYLKRDIHILEKRGGDIMDTIHILATYAQLPYLELNIDRNFVLTWSIDGIVCIFDANSKKLDSMFFPQNRYAHRIRKTIVSPSRRYAISLSTQGNVKCFEMEPNFENSPKIADFATIRTSEIMEAMLTKYTNTVSPRGGHSDKTWLELKYKQELENQRTLYKDKRQGIYDDFLKLKENLKKLIDANEDLSKIERLPLHNFNLNKEYAESLYEIARQERELEDKTLKAYVADQNRITQWIIDNTWNLMEKQGRRIRGVFSSINCDNYPLIHSDESQKDTLMKVILWLKTENMVANKDKLQAWIPSTPEKMMKKLKQMPNYVEDELRQSSISSRETMSQDSSQDIVGRKYFKYALSGTSTHNFIEPCPQRYEQMDVVTFQQTFVEKILGELDMYNLRICFNKEFDDLYKFKEDQMYQVKKRNDRLRKIQSELNILEQLKQSDKKYGEIIVDPEYELDEQPERIKKVDDSEIKMIPYISPRKQKLLDEEALQLELKRLELLADDFRERALMSMMDGVLEKRWEDEIKKTPSPPECINSGKKTEDLTKDDTRTIQEYEAQLKALNVERDKYRNMMLEERTKLQQMQSETIMRFNVKCASLFIRKHQIDAAIRQEELKLLRNSLNNYDRILHKRKEMKYMTDITEDKRSIDKLILTIEDLEKRVNDCKLRYDQLQSRDRLLDRQFKSQFAENAPSIVVDQAYKIFKKRPKWIARAWVTAAILQDMANRIITRNHTKSGIPIPEECYEFLTLIDSLENIASAPNSIAPHLWHILCNLRRQKMESEFKLKAQGIQLAEAEATLNALNKELTAKKLRIAEIEKEREDFRQIYYSNLRNRYVQLVVPMGIIEVPLTGHMDDFKGNVLLHASDIDDINAIIKKSGSIKLKTMSCSAIFRRKIIYKEWEHKMLQMEVKRMQDNLAIIEKCKVTKVIQMYLKRKDMKLLDDLSQSALNREIEATRTHLKRTLDDMTKMSDRLTNQLGIKRRQNKFLDAEISRINVDVTEQNLLRDYAMEEQEQKEHLERMETVVERGKLIRKVQAQHSQILELATMLELQRLRTYPTLHAPKTNPFS